MSHVGFVMVGLASLMHQGMQGALLQMRVPEGRAAPAAELSSLDPGK